MSFTSTLVADLEANSLIGAGNVGFFSIVRAVIVASFYNPSFMCVFWYRVNRLLYERGHWRLSRFLSAQRRYRFSNDISPAASIGPGLYIPHLPDIVIGTKAVIGSRATIFNGVTVGTKWMHDKKMPVIGDNVIIGTGAKLLGSIRIGNNVVIGALSFCGRDVPDNSIAYGIPPNFTIKPYEGKLASGS
ncbi:MAG: serine O-acetyltransferase [Patescibacteria group bacterium]|nr:serine O-acetyltransferase [Patescibacteria group bacterium]